MTSAISAARACSPSAIFCRKPARSLAGVAAQLGKAFAAAATALLMSSAVPAGTVAKISSVVESVTSSTSDDDGATHAPSIYKESRTIMKPPIVCARNVASNSDATIAQEFQQKPKTIL